MTVSTKTKPAGIPRPAKPTRPLSTRGTHTQFNIHKHLPTAFQRHCRYIVSLTHALCTLSLGMAVLPLADGAPVTLPLTVPLTSPCTSRLLAHAASATKFMG